MGAIQNSINGAIGTVAAGAALGKRMVQENEKIQQIETANKIAQENLERQQAVDKAVGTAEIESIAAQVEKGIGNKGYYESARDTAEDFMKSKGESESFENDLEGQQVFLRMYHSAYDNEMKNTALKAMIDSLGAKQSQSEIIKTTRERIKRGR